MGGGKSPVGKGGGGGKTAVNAAVTSAVNTPSGITFDQFSRMSDAQKYATMESILSNSSIQIPPELENGDNSYTTKLLYALGRTDKPTLVDDSALDGMQGMEIFRTVYDMPRYGINVNDVVNQTQNGNMVQLSGKGGSAHGRAIYFARDFKESARYGHGESNPTVIRSKIKPTAKIVKEDNLSNSMNNDVAFQKIANKYGRKDAKALYAVSHGIDGWIANTWGGQYVMMVNRGGLNMSKTAKSLHGTYKRGPKKGQQKTGYAQSWNTAG